MAKLASQTIVIEISKAVPDDAPDQITILDSETLTNISTLISELVGDGNVVVEVTVA